MIPMLVLATVLTGVGADDVTPPRRPEDAVAQVGGTTITLGQLDDAAAKRLISLRSQEYDILRRALDDLIARTLLENEAKRQGLTLAELKAREIDAKVPAVRDDEAKFLYDDVKERFAGMSESDAIESVKQRLQDNRRTRREKQYVEQLRQAAGVSVLLQVPRALSDEHGAATRGPANAPVTIVEFSDFECPYCGRATPTITALEKRYPTEVRRVFKHLPLPIHKNAPKAAEAAICAGEQGKFWEMHDKLFASQQKLSRDEYTRLAQELQLAPEPFASCLDSGRAAKVWMQDKAEADGYGIAGTPVFLVNGRMISGAAPVEKFQEVIEEELKLKSAGTASH
jgi:protein-disulfide isomerase